MVQYIPIAMFDDSIPTFGTVTSSFLLVDARLVLFLHSTPVL